MNWGIVAANYVHIPCILYGTRHTLESACRVASHHQKEGAAVGGAELEVLYPSGV